jgi:hypothetical protein
MESTEELLRDALTAGVGFPSVIHAQTAAFLGL